MPEILETELPGIGRRFTLPLETGGELAVVVHKSGDKDLYFRENERADPLAVTLSDAEARRVAAVLTGGFWQPSNSLQFARISWRLVPQIQNYVRQSTKQLDRVDRLASEPGLPFNFA